MLRPLCLSLPLVGLLAAPAFAGNCSTGQKYVTSLPAGGAAYELKATCKGSWTVSSNVYLYSIRIHAEEEGGTERECLGDIFTASGKVAEVRRQKVECEYEGSDHKVKVELTKQ